jgi:hypothetical protein
MTSLSKGRCQWKEQLLLGTLGQGTLIGPMRTNHHPRKQEKVRAEIFRKEALAKIKEMKLSSQEYGRRHNTTNTGTEENTRENEPEQQKNEEVTESNKGKGKIIEDTEMGNEGDKTDSDDSGSYFEDFMSPRGKHFTFGDFQNIEIPNILNMRVKGNTSPLEIFRI